jgi:hypothetical protein
MTRSEVDELGYIVPIATVPSILQRGILSHRRAEEISHESIALQEVQDLRAKVIVPNGRLLHEYTNLYICANFHVNGWAAGPCKLGTLCFTNERIGIKKSAFFA